jgi:hypothetical protein
MNLCNHAWTVDRTTPGGELELEGFRRKDTAMQYALERGGAVRKSTVYDIGHYRCEELARKVASLIAEDLDRRGCAIGALQMGVVVTMLKDAVEEATCHFWDGFDTPREMGWVGDDGNP